MRKLNCILLAMLLVFSCGTAAFASETQQIGVYAQTRQEVQGVYTAPVANGVASVTVDGVTLSVTGCPENAVTLLVIPMEGEALSWIRSCLKGNVLSAWDISFQNAQGERINADGVAISVTTSAGTTTSVSSVTTTGSVRSLAVELSVGKLKFQADGSHYYVLAETPRIKTEVETLESGHLSDQLKEAGFDTPAKVEEELVTKVMTGNSGITENQTAVYDVTLMYSTDGGNTWTPADESHFPADGRLPVSLPIPAGTHPDTHDYHVVHMFSRDAFGKQAGDVEYPEVWESENQISFYVTGLSPIVVAWVETTGTEPHEHSFTTKASDVKAADATCTEAARYYVQCNGCSEHTTEKTVAVGEPLDHIWDEGTITTKPTCDKDGIRTFTCQRDSSHTDTKPEPATGHSFTQYHSNKDATCKKDGTETAKCDHGCGKTDTRTDWGSRLGHKYQDGKCIRCGLSWWNPETGDTILIAVAVMALSCAATLLLLAYRRKKQQK